MDPPGGVPRILTVPADFSLAVTCAPVFWARGRWPQWGWREGEFFWAGWEEPCPVWRGVRLRSPGELVVRGSADPALDRGWGVRVLSLDQSCPIFADPVVAALRSRYPGLYPFSAGSLFEGVVTAIVGQSISVAAAAVVLGRLAALFAVPLGSPERPLRPLPRPAQLAAADRALVRATGVTWRRADALIAAGIAFRDGDPPAPTHPDDLDPLRAWLRALPLVGPWTVEATLLWGIAAADAHVAGDVALLRCTRSAYDRPDLTMKELDRLADGWRPARAWAARLLWCAGLGVPDDDPSANG